ncbi:hypothetical protein V4Y02_24120, partial [Escherichia coli]
MSYLFQLITAIITEYRNSLDVQSDILVVVSQSIKDFFLNLVNHSSLIILSVCVGVIDFFIPLI